MLPANDDYKLMTYAENEQLLRLSNAAILLNNTVYVVSKCLSARIEDISTPLADNRKTERVLCTVLRQASKLVNDVTMRVNVLATGIARRDAMLRAGLDPAVHRQSFASLQPTRAAFDADIGVFY